jgi:hypothetical protein
MVASIIAAIEAISISSAIASFAVNFALSYVVTRIFGSKPPQQQNTGIRQQIPPSQENSIPVVYGSAWLGGTFVDAVLSTDAKTMYYVLVISHISPNGQFAYDTTKFYYGDRLITFDGTDQTKVVSLTDGAGNVDTKIAGKVYINLYTSTAGGTITSANGAAAPSTVMGGADITPSLQWTGTRQMNGLAFAIIKVNYDVQAGSTGLQPVTFKVAHTLNGTGVAKPGDVLYDYLTSTVYGGRVPAGNVNTTACTALNTYSDQTITYTPSGGGSATQARYRINGVINTGETILNNVDKILTACDSWISYQTVSGQWTPIVNREGITAFAFDDSNIMGEIRVSATDLSQSVNQIEISFPNKDNKDQPNYVYLKTPPNLLYPNEPVNKYSGSFDMVNDSVQAQYLANRVLEQAREDLIVGFNTAYPGIQVDVGDVVSVTEADYGWNAKLFRVMRVTEVGLPEGGLGAQFELYEYNAQVYDDKDITQFTPAPNSNLPSGYYFPSLAAPTFSDQAPSAQPPTFSVNLTLPSTVRTTVVTLYYTTSVTPTVNDWLVWNTQTASNGSVLPAGSAIKFPNVVVGSGTYYFAYTIGNEIAVSQLSATSTGFSWSPTVPVGPTGPTGGSGPTGSSGPTGTSGTQAAVANLYQWSTSTPTNPSGQSTWTWATGTNGSYTGGGGWSTTVPANPGSPLLYLWVASKAVTATAGTATSTVSWTSGYSVTATTGNGAAGTQSATPTVYQWAVTVPSISGTSTYTWATQSFTPVPSGWSTSITSSPSPGYTLWAARVPISDSLTATTTTINWSTASIIASGYAGATGASSRTMYARIAGNPTPVSGTVTVSGDNRPSGAQAAAVWGASFNVTWYANDPDPSSNNSLYQSDGIWDGTNTNWSTPYISSLKVGSLSAVSVNTGNLTVTGTFQSNTAAISGTSMTGSGGILYPSGQFAFGNSTTNMTFNGSTLNINGLTQSYFGTPADINTGTSYNLVGILTVDKAAPFNWIFNCSIVSGVYVYYGAQSMQCQVRIYIGTSLYPPALMSDYTEVNVYTGAAGWTYSPSTATTFQGIVLPVNMSGYYNAPAPGTYYMFVGISLDAFYDNSGNPIAGSLPQNNNRTFNGLVYMYQTKL